MATATHDVSFIELGLVVVGLAVLARLANRWGFSAIPLYLVAGLAFGNGGLAPLKLSESFIGTGAEIGVLLLLFMLGLEYSGNELKESLRVRVSGGYRGPSVELHTGPHRWTSLPVGTTGCRLAGWRYLYLVLGD